jgi:hypothetical protein
MMDIDAGKAALPVDDSRGDARLTRKVKIYLVGPNVCSRTQGGLV